MLIGRMKTSWLKWKKNVNWSGTGTSHDHLDWPRLSYREQFKEEDEEADRGKDGKTTSRSGLALNGTSYNGKLSFSFSFSSRWHRSARKGPYALRPVSQQSPQGCPRNSANICLVEYRPFSAFEGGMSESWEPQWVKEAGCKIYSGAPRVSQTMG